MAGNIDVASIVLFSADPVKTIAFYHRLGIALEDEDHGDGLVHAACNLGSVHFAVFQASTVDLGRVPEWRCAGSTFTGFYVTSLDEAVAAIALLGARILDPHQQRPWGCRAIIEDPDGRTVEINQRDHCLLG